MPLCVHHVQTEMEEDPFKLVAVREYRVMEANKNLTAVSTNGPVLLPITSWEYDMKQWLCGETDSELTDMGTCIVQKQIAATRNPEACMPPRPGTELLYAPRLILLLCVMGLILGSHILHEQRALGG